MGFLKGLLNKAGGRHQEEAPSLPPGLALHRAFKLERTLGQGAFSTVYEAERLADGQRYALKVTELAALSQLDKVAAVEEIRLLASLRHPNIIGFWEAFCDHGRLCVITELMAGGDLASFIAKTYAADDFLWERQVWALFLQAALGVQHLHHQHVLHRDLKPQNMMLAGGGGKGSPPGLLKIVDLGVSAELARVFTNVQIGTPHYMAPEMWSRRAYSYSADIWALGCILHELCTLRPAFLGEGDRTEEDIKRRVLSGQRASAIPGRYSWDLRRLVELMLRPDPRERPTIDEIFRMPEVRAQFAHLPPELQGLAEAQQQRTSLDPGGRLEAAVQLPEDVHSINCLLPPARYPTGGGVAELLTGHSKRRAVSLADPASAGSQGAASGSGSEASDAFAGGGGRGMHPSASQGQFDAEEHERRLRRRSVMVGDLLHRLQQEEAEAAEGGPAEAAPRLRHSHDSAADASLRRLSGTHGGAAWGLASPPPAYGTAAAAGQAAATPAGPGDGPAGSASGVRHSVAVAEVLSHHEATQGARHHVAADALPTQAAPLPRGPFEFCATPGGNGGSAGSPAPTPSAAADPAAPRSALLSQLATGGGGGGGAGVLSAAQALHQQQPALAPQTPHYGAPVQQQAQQGGAAPAAAAAKQEKKKKKHGRLWRLVHGVHEEESSMHQPLW